MERLTELKYDITKLDSRIKNMHEYIEKMAFDDKAEVEFLASTVSYLKELKEYKQLEEQSLLLKLPVPIGTTVYEFEPLNRGVKECTERTVIKYTIYDDSIWFTFANGLGRNIEDFGKTVFLTKSEAEQKLKELKEIGNRE